MFKNFEDPLKSELSMTDMFYVSLLLNERDEIMPLEVSFEDIFYDLIEVKTEFAISRNSELIVSMYNDDVVYNITGKVVRIFKQNTLYQATIKIEPLPTKLFNDLINMMKELVGEINQK